MSRSGGFYVSVVTSASAIFISTLQVPRIPGASTHSPEHHQTPLNAHRRAQRGRFPEGTYGGRAQLGANRLLPDVPHPPLEPSGLMPG